MRLRTLVSGLFLGATLAYGGTAVAQTRVCTPAPQESVLEGVDTLTPAALEALTSADRTCIKPVYKIGTVNLEVCVPGKKNCIPCTPGAKYSLPTLGSDDVVTFTCPDQKPIAGKPSCLSQFDKHGTCLDDNLAGAFGLTERVDGYCTGANTHCYDATKAKPFATVDDLKAATDRLDNAGGKGVPLEKALADAKLSDLETFFVSLGGDNCKEDYARLKGMLTDVRNARDTRDTATKGLKECLDKVPAQEGKVPVGRELLKYTEAVPACPEQGAALKDKNDKYEKAVSDFKTAIDFLKEHGCNYKEPVQPVKQPIQVDAIAKAVYAFGNGASAVGVEVEVQVTSALDENGVVRLGGYANGGYNHRKADSKTTDDLGFAVQETEEAKTIDRLVGAGAVLKVRAVSKGYLDFDFKAGGAAKRTTLERTTTVAGKSNNVSKTDYDFVGEFATGVTTGYVSKGDKWSIRIGPEFRVDTQKDMGIMGVLGVYWK
ncbi:MAG: hypothetical protein V2A62_04700 [Candidatus Woesearchaeota archaeon]